jgi:photosystem II stability/assembly factor-like uncharacterized protein
MSRIATAATLLALALPASASAALPTNFSGWRWGAPEPQGHNLFAIEFQGASGYAAGDFGTLLATGDGGNSWSPIHTGETIDFRHLDVIGPQSLVVGSSCALRRTDDGGATFRRLPFTSSERNCARQLRGISFPTGDVGYLLFEDGAVLKTTDDGESFSSLTGLPPGGLTAIAFQTDQIGLLANAGGDIFRTTDGGRTWTTEYDGEVRLSALFVSGSLAVAVGNADTFVSSGDSGDTWVEPVRQPSAPPPTPQDFQSVRCASADVCLMTTPQGVIVRTADAGATFQPATNGFGQAVDFASVTRAVAVARGGRMLVSDDGGARFTLQGARVPEGGSPNHIRTTSASVAHVTGFTRVFERTTDAGETWTRIGVPTPNAVQDVAFPTASLGYALDAGGGLFRTTNGGVAWSILDTGTRQAPQAIFAPDSRVVLLIGPRGMFRSTDGGETFARLRHPVVRVRTLVNAERAGTGVLAYGPRVIALSTNKGRTWRRIVRPTQQAEVVSASFVSAKRGYVLETDGRAYTTRDAGKHWTELVALGHSTGRQFAFSDARNGWLALGIGPATLLRTTDGGRSWRPQIIGNTGDPIVAAPAARIGYAAFGGFGASGIVFTRTGGDTGTRTRLTIDTKQRAITRRRTVTVTGRLSPARAGAQVEVHARALKGRRWRIARATVGRDGRFSVGWRVSTSSVFVAQWAGDARTAGDGTPALVVTRKRRG